MRVTGLAPALGALVLSALVAPVAAVASAQVAFTGPTTYAAGDRVSITAVLNTSDPNENGEGEPLVIQSTTGFSATDPFYAVPQGYFFIAPSAGSLSAFIGGFDDDESGSVTVSIAPGSCPTAIPTPSPAPPGCPVQLLTKAQKDALASISLRMGVLGTGTGVLALFCGSATAGTCAIPLGIIAGILAGGSAYAAYVAAVDPSDPNFMVIAQPVVPTFTALTATGGVTQAEANAYNALLANLATETAYFRALITTVNRAQGAADAGDAHWQTQQTNVGEGYIGTLGLILRAQPALLANFQAALAAAGVNRTFAANDVLQAESIYAFNGLPLDMFQGLVQLGFTNAEIAQIRQILQVQDINVVAGNYPGMLTDPGLIAALQNAAQTLNPTIQVDIALKPGTTGAAPINVKSHGKIPVAILSTANFNAVTSVDVTSLTFGHSGAEASLAFCNAGGEDVDGDGIPDLVCHFDSPASAFVAGDVKAVLKGRTIGGVLLTGSAPIVTVP